jgi:hypothetical protein
LEEDGKPAYIRPDIQGTTYLLFNEKLNRWMYGNGFWSHLSDLGSITGSYVNFVTGESELTVAEYGTGHTGNNPDNTDSNDPLTSLTHYYKIIHDNDERDLYTGIFIPSSLTAGENTVVYENALPYKSSGVDENGKHGFIDEKTYLWRKDGYWHIGLKLGESLFTLGKAEEPTGIWTWNGNPLEVVKVDNTGATTATEGQE